VTSTTRAGAIGTVLLLLTANGAAWADQAETWLEGSDALASAAEVSSAGTPPEPERLDLQRLVHAAERREEAASTAPPIAGSFDYGEAGAEFGAARAGHVHEGQDLFAPAGTPLVAVRDGVILSAGSDAGRGNYVEIYSQEADETYVYFHMQAPAEVTPGERVRAGAEIGRLGCTGSCYGDHLHFEVHAGEGAEARVIDPLPLLERLTR
jgi:murein DD-endopeptidase MepM/ murein hydrolase activator NlpD